MTLTKLINELDLYIDEHYEAEVYVDKITGEQFIGWSLKAKEQ